MKRHQILGNDLPSLTECLQSLAEGEADRHREIAAAKGPQQFSRELLIMYPVMYAVLEHLGYGPIKDLLSRLDRGVDESLEYFFGRWWIGDEDEINLNKSRPDRELRWFEVLAYALLLGGLTGRWHDVEKICSWFDSSIETQYQAGMLEDEYMLLFLCIASNLSPQPLPTAADMLAKVKACRTKRPKLLCAAWEAAVAKDQKVFDKALKDSVAHFLKTDADGNAPNVNFWVALHPSIVWLIAERNGLSFPTLPEKLDAAVVRRQTIGLA